MQDGWVAGAFFFDSAIVVVDGNVLERKTISESERVTIVLSTKVIMILRGHRATTCTWFADGGESTQIGSSTGTKKVTTLTNFVLVWWLKTPCLTKPECSKLRCLTRVCREKYILLDSSKFSVIIGRFGTIIAKNHKPSRTFIAFSNFNSHQKAIFVHCNGTEFSKWLVKNWRTCSTRGFQQKCVYTFLFDDACIKTGVARRHSAVYL